MAVGATCQIRDVSYLAKVHPDMFDASTNEWGERLMIDAGAASSWLEFQNLKKACVTTRVCDKVGRVSSILSSSSRELERRNPHLLRNVPTRL